MLARPHQRLWSRLLAAEAPVTSGQLCREIGASFQTVDYRLGLWVRAGLVERQGGRPVHYSLANDTERSSLPPAISSSGRALQRKPTGYQRIWASIRVLRHFDLPMLAMTAGTSARTTLGYVGLLQRTGYVRLERLGNARTGLVSRYALVRNTGRQAPRETIVRSGDGTRRVFIDGNTGERHDVGTGSPSRRRSYRRADVVDGGVS